MKTESDFEETKTVDVSEDTKEKRTKKKIQSSESQGKTKIKKSGSLIKRFKLKSKNATSSSAPESEPSDDPQPTTSEAEPVERQTPEGDDSLPVGKAVSETNLTETSWKSAETLTKEDNPKSTSVVNVQSSQYQITISELDKITSHPQRTKSLENLKAMPAFGDLIVDPNTGMVNKRNFFNYIKFY